jgi:hypothetical protein
MPESGDYRPARTVQIGLAFRVIEIDTRTALDGRIETIKIPVKDVILIRFSLHVSYFA